MTITDERLDELAQIAAQLVARVRDEDPDEYGRWLEATVPTFEEQRALLYVLAAAIPTDVAFGHLVAWTRMDRALDPVHAQRQDILTASMAPVSAVAA